MLAFKNCALPWVKLALALSTAGVALSAETGQDSQASALAGSARSVLERRCVGCHGALEVSGLDMRTREGILKGGTRGPALIPGKAGESLLFLAAAQSGPLKMPPQTPPLPGEELETLRRWIDAEAPWPAAPAIEKTKS